MLYFISHLFSQQSKNISKIFLAPNSSCYFYLLTLGVQQDHKIWGSLDFNCLQKFSNTHLFKRWNDHNSMSTTEVNVLARLSKTKQTSTLIISHQKQQYGSNICHCQLQVQLILTTQLQKVIKPGISNNFTLFVNTAVVADNFISISI